MAITIMMMKTTNPISEVGLPTSEHAIQQAVFDYLVGEGFLVLRLNSGRKGHVAFVRWQVAGREVHTTGVSDLLALGPNRQFLAIEVKTPGGRASRVQSNFLIEAEKRGAVAVTAASIDDLKRAICPKGAYER